MQSFERLWIDLFESFKYLIDYLFCNIFFTMNHDVVDELGYLETIMK
jgi:hypothetical protein